MPQVLFSNNRETVDISQMPFALRNYFMFGFQVSFFHCLYIIKYGIIIELFLRPKPAIIQWSASFSHFFLTTQPPQNLTLSFQDTAFAPRGAQRTQGFPGRMCDLLKKETKIWPWNLIT